MFKIQVKHRQIKFALDQDMHFKILELLSFKNNFKNVLCIFNCNNGVNPCHLKIGNFPFFYAAETKTCQSFQIKV